METNAMIYPECIATTVDVLYEAADVFDIVRTDAEAAHEAAMRLIRYARSTGGIITTDGVMAWLRGRLETLAAAALGIADLMGVLEYIANTPAGEAV